MAATTHDLALRYLLELSSDIRLALLWAPDGELLAAAPDPVAADLAGLAEELVREAGAHFESANGSTLELDAGCDRGAVFLLRDVGMTMLCLTERSVLPGLIFYDMHAVLG